MTPADRLLSVRAEFNGAQIQGFSHEAAVRLALQRAEALGLDLDAGTLEALLKELPA